MSIQFGIVLAYIVFLFGISLYAKKRASTSTGFLFAGRKLTTLLVATNITGIAVGAASTIGVAENAFKVGIGAGWYNGAWAAGAVVMALVAADRFRRMECTTIPELFERYYDKKARIISVIGLITIQIVVTSLQYVAGGAILSTLLPDIFTFHGGMLMSALVFIGTTLIGGLWSAGLANVVSVVIIYLGILFSTMLTVEHAGGFDGMMAALPQNVGWFDPIGPLGLATVVGWFVVMITQALSAQAPVQVACAAADGRTAKRGFLLGALLIFPIGFLCAIMGIAAKAMHPEISATMALPQMIMALDPFVSGITLAALWAADVSTACALLLGAGTLFSQDIFKRFIRPNIDEKGYTRVNRIAILGIGLMTLWLAFNAVGILKTMLIGLSLTTAFTLVFLMTIFAPSLCRKNTPFYTTLAGMIALVAWQVCPDVRIFAHPIYMQWLVCVVTFFIVMIVDKQKIKEITYK